MTEEASFTEQVRQAAWQGLMTNPAPGITPVSNRLFGGSDTDLVQVTEQVGRVLIDGVCPARSKGVPAQDAGILRAANARNR
jgi:hypothetical protein